MYIPKNMEPEDSLGKLRLICQGAKKGEVVVWNVKGQEGNSYGYGKQMFGKQMFSGFSPT